MAKMLVTIVMATVAGTALLPWWVLPACSVVEYAMDLRSCFKMRDLAGDVIIHQKASMVDTSLQLEGMMHDPQRVCHNKEKFSGLIDCLGGITTRCITTDAEKSYVPNATLAKEGLTYFCRHVEGIDQACYNQSYKEVFQCVEQLSTENLKPDDSAATKACTTVDITHDCINEHVSCDEKTRDLLLMFQDVYRKPEGCLAPTRSDRKKYITSTGNSMAVFVSKVFCVSLSFIIIMLQTD